MGWDRWTEVLDAEKCAGAIMLRCLMRIEGHYLAQGFGAWMDFAAEARVQARLRSVEENAEAKVRALEAAHARTIAAMTAAQEEATLNAATLKAYYQQHSRKEEEHPELRALFDSLDVNGDGAVSKQELVKGVHRMDVKSGVHLVMGLPAHAIATRKANAVDRFFNHADVDGDSKLAFAEFVAAVKAVGQEAAAEEEQAKKEAKEAQAKKEAKEAQAKKKAKEEQAKKEAEEEQAKKEAKEEQAKKETKEEQAKKEAKEEQAKKEAEEEQAKKEAEEQAKKEGGGIEEAAKDDAAKDEGAAASAGVADAVTLVGGDDGVTFVEGDQVVLADLSVLELNGMRAQVLGSLTKNGRCPVLVLEGDKKGAKITVKPEKIKRWEAAMSGAGSAASGAGSAVSGAGSAVRKLQAMNAVGQEAAAEEEQAKKEVEEEQAKKEGDKIEVKLQAVKGKQIDEMRANGEAKECTSCKQQRAKSEYSGKQWHAKNRRRCRRCIADAGHKKSE
jgi:Ca2+-binding EF-hand superfamily protein